MSEAGDDLDATIDEWAKDDPEIRGKIDAALQRRSAESLRPTIPEVVADFARYYADNPTWGSLHIVLDDYNVEDSHVEFCIRWADKEGDAEGKRLAQILSVMSRTQRRKIGPAAEQFDGEKRPKAPEIPTVKHGW